MVFDRIRRYFQGRSIHQSSKTSALSGNVDVGSSSGDPISSPEADRDVGSRDNNRDNENGGIENGGGPVLSDRVSYRLPVFPDGPNHQEDDDLPRHETVSTLRKILDVDQLQNEIERAEAFYHDQKWEQAVEQCRSVFALDASHAPTHKLMGNALVRLGQKDNARAAYEQAIAHDPDFADVYVNLGNLDAQDKRWDRAIAHYQQAIALKPDFAGAYRNLAKVWTQKGNERLATECLFHAVEREPDSLDWQGYFKLGNQLLKQGQPKQAIHCYQYLLSESVGTESETRSQSSQSQLIDISILHNNLADALAQTEQWQEAVVHYRKAQQLQLMRSPLTDSKQGARNSPLSFNISSLLPGTDQSEQIVAISNPLGSSNELAPIPIVDNPDIISENAQINDLTLSPSSSRMTVHPSSVFQTAQRLAKQGQWDQVLHIIKQEVEVVEPELNQRYELLAKAFRLEGNLEGAMEYYKKMLMLYPNQTKILANLGSLYAQQNQWQEAKAAYQQAIQLDPKFAGAYRNLARVWQSMGNEEAATDCWGKAYELEPEGKTASDHLTLGQALVKQGKVSAAIASFSRAIDQDATLTQAYFQLAECHRQQGGDELAMFHYGKALHSDPTQSDPNHYDAIYALGQLLAKHGDMERAIACFQKMIQLTSLDVRGYQGLRDVLITTNNLSQALSCYEKLAQLQPDSSEVYHEWGEALNQLEQWQEAIPVFRHAIQLNPEHFESHNMLGEVFLHLGLWQDAVDSFQHAIALNPKSFWSHHNLGKVLLELENWQTAVHHFKQAIALNPQFAWSHYSLGVALSKLNRWDEALAVYQRVQSLDETLKFVSNKLIEALRQLIRQSPHDISLYQTLAAELRQEGKIDEAIATYQMVLHIDSSHQPSLRSLAELIEPLDLHRSQALLKQVQQTNFSTLVYSPVNLDNLKDVANAKAILARTNLFDSHYYQAVYGISGYENGLEHYLRTGATLGYNPNPLFDSTYYIQQYLKATDTTTLNPLVHYYAVGHRHNCNPHPLFNQRFYVSQNPDIAMTGLPPLEHYLSLGTKAGQIAFSIDKLHALIKENILPDAPYLKGLQSLFGDLDSNNSNTTKIAQSVGIYCSSLGNYFMTDIAAYITAALTQIGHDVVMLNETDNPTNSLDLTIIVAPHEFFYLGEGHRLASDVQWWSNAIMVNLEQPQTSWFSKAFHFLRQSRLILDINIKSAALLHALNLPAHWLPLGYLKDYEPLTADKSLPDSLPLKHLSTNIRQTCPRIFAPLLERPIDIYFVGTLNGRREEFLGQNASCFQKYNCFLHTPSEGTPLTHDQEETLKINELASIGCRSKILLNVHRDELPYFEWHRIIFYGLWQNTLVVTENCHSVPGLLPNIHFIDCSLDEMGAKIDWLLSTPEGRKQSELVRWAGYRAFKKHYSGTAIMRNIVNLARSYDK